MGVTNKTEKLRQHETISLFTILIGDYAKQIPLPDGILILKILLSVISVYAMLFVVTYFKQLPVLKHYRKQGITMMPGVESFPFSNMPAFMAYSKAADIGNGEVNSYDSEKHPVVCFTL